MSSKSGHAITNKSGSSSMLVSEVTYFIVGRILDLSAPLVVVVSSRKDDYKDDVQGGGSSVILGLLKEKFNFLFNT